MELFDYDFHPFTEKGTGTAGVLYPMTRRDIALPW